MKVKEIQVLGLFGTFNHSIPLTYSDHVTLVHGPNGFGKTMMLKMIAAFVNGRTEIFEQVPFHEFRVILDDDSVAIVRHREEDDAQTDNNRRSKLEIAVTNKHGENLLPILVNDLLPDVPKSVLDHIDQFIPGPYGRFGSGWRDNSSGKTYSLNEIIEYFPRAAAALPRKYKINPFSTFVESLEVFFVETKRLDAEKTPRSYIPRPEDDSFFSEEEDSPPQQRHALRVDQYSKDIVQRIKSALADYAKHSQESDRTFPERLVRSVQEGVEPLPERQILQQMVELENKRQRLISLGFLDSESGLRDLNEDGVRRAAGALSIYVSDVQQKLAVFDDLADRVGRLMDIVNERFKYKTLTLHRELGFRLKTTSGEAIELEDLSSGEQHELVVLYELLFRAPRNGLVLVDEPEISLHVAWQSRFLQDLMGILKLTGSYGIVATHSPVIIGTRWDLTKELIGPETTSDEIAV